MTELQVTAYFFRLAVCIPPYSRMSNGVVFLRKFFVRLTVLPLQGFEVTHPIFRNFDDAENMVARCFSPFSAKRYFSLPNAVEKRQI